MKKVLIVGAGPGGLTAGMILAAQGCDVRLIEKSGLVGGRNACLEAGPYKFDLGPTFLMMKFILDEVFDLAGKRSGDYLDFIELSPMYRLHFKDKHLDIYSDHDKTREEIRKAFPGEEKGLDKFLANEKIKFDRMLPCLKTDYSSWQKMLSKNLLKALPRLSLSKSVYGVIGKYFTDRRLRISFNFQTKYLGMSPWECPGAFAILPYVEHAFGIYHVRGGLSRISDAMAQILREYGGQISLNSEVTKILVENKKAVGVELAGGEKFFADAVFINADFAYAMSSLIDQENLRKYSGEKMRSKKYSCSTFMLYLGLDRQYPDLPHHNIFFSADYKKNLEEIFKTWTLPRDMSFYIRNSSLNDPLVAPPGHSNIYVLVPVPNLQKKIDWKKEKQGYRSLVIEAIKTRTPLADIESAIREELIITPADWLNEYNVYNGAVFNLAHNLRQMLYFRPHNRFEELKNCYLVGGGTHPGSGLPTIYESARISAELFLKNNGIKT